MVGRIKEFLDDYKATNIVVIDLIGKASFADYIMIATGTSKRHVSNMADRLRKDLKEFGIKDISIEGLTHGSWVLIDGGDIIINLFLSESRKLYDLESLWGKTG